jgi:acetyl-CoA C-acetyltransferase
VPGLKPAFERDGTITAANASTIADGAAAVVVASEAACARHGLRPRARVVATATAGREPAEFPVAPIDAVRRVLERARLSADDVDLWEINEAFAVVALACMRELDHPAASTSTAAPSRSGIRSAQAARVSWSPSSMRSSSARLRRGLATLCLGGGEAIAMVIDREYRI